MKRPRRELRSNRFSDWRRSLFAVVRDRRDAEALGEAQRLIGAGVVYKDNIVDNIGRDFRERPLQRDGCIVSRQNYAKLF